MDYIRFVDIKNKRIYDLGKRVEAKRYISFMAFKFQGKPVIFYGDETHEFLDDKYEIKEYGGEYEDYSMENEVWDSNLLDETEMSKEEFDKLYDMIGGKVVTNLDDYIQNKYRPQ